MNKFLPICIIILFGSQNVLAQNAPVFNQFYANPFQFNPAFIANNGYTEANLFYRKQWIGIENAPTTASINFQAPVGRNVSLGFNAYSDKAILLSTTSASGTFGYRARLGKDHHLNFGLSAGLGFNNFNFAALEDTNDPVLQNITQNNVFLSGQFGINYRLKNLTLGFALPKLFSSQPNNTGENFSELKFDEFRNKFGSASYTFKVKNVQIIPMAIYRALDNVQDQWEGVLITNIKDLFWVGASYRTNYGLIGMIGVNLKGLLRVGYSYEHPTGDIGQVSNGSHEIYLGARFGKNTRDEEIIARQENSDSVKQVVDTAPVEEVKQEEVVIVAEPDQKIEEEKPEVVSPEQAVIIPSVVPAPVEENKTPDGYYLVVGVFQQKANADRRLKQITRDGYAADIYISPIKGRHYVYIFHSLDKEETRKELESVNAKNKFSGAWIYAPGK